MDALYHKQKLFINVNFNRTFLLEVSTVSFILKIPADSLAGDFLQLES